jgi:hypothetical protein
MSQHGKVAAETWKQMLQHHQSNSETSEITSFNIEQTPVETSPSIRATSNDARSNYSIRFMQHRKHRPGIQPQAQLEGDIASVTGGVAARTTMDDSCLPTLLSPFPTRGSGGAFPPLKSRASLKRPPDLGWICTLAVEEQRPHTASMLVWRSRREGSSAPRRHKLGGPCSTVLPLSTGEAGRAISEAKAAGAHGRLLDLEEGRPDSGREKHGYPWVPTDQGPIGSCQVDPTCQKPRRPASGPGDLIHNPGDLGRPRKSSSRLRKTCRACGASFSPRSLLTNKRCIPLRSASVRTPHLFHHWDSQGSCQFGEQGDYKRSIYLHTLTTQTLTMIKLENN